MPAISIPHKINRNTGSYFAVLSCAKVMTPGRGSEKAGIPGDFVPHLNFVRRLDMAVNSLIQTG